MLHYYDFLMIFFSITYSKLLSKTTWDARTNALKIAFTSLYKHAHSRTHTLTLTRTRTRTRKHTTYFATYRYQAAPASHHQATQSTLSSLDPFPLSWLCPFHSQNRKATPTQQCYLAWLPFACKCSRKTSLSSCPTSHPSWCFHLRGILLWTYACRRSIPSVPISITPLCHRVRK